MHLEKCSKEFESHGFHTLGLLKYFCPGDNYMHSSLQWRNCYWQKNTSWKAKLRWLLTWKLSQRFNSFSGKKNTPRWKKNIIIASRTQEDPDTTQKAEWIRSFVDWEKLKSGSFSVMCNQLCLKNLPKYSDRLKLDKDLLVLHTACITNEVLEWDPKEGNWQLLIITEQFHHAKLASLFAGEKNLCWQPFTVDFNSLWPRGCGNILGTMLK